MQGLEVELLGALDRDKAHGRPLHRFCNRFAIDVVVLVGLYERLYELGRNQTNLVALCDQPGTKEVCPATGLHADQT